MPRNRTLVRGLSLLRLLEDGRHYQLQELAKTFGVCVRTIRRDLEALEEVGVPLRHEWEADSPGRPGTWWVG